VLLVLVLLVLVLVLVLFRSSQFIARPAAFISSGLAALVKEVDRNREEESIGMKLDCL
jgi:hypothetical protein